MLNLAALNVGCLLLMSVSAWPQIVYILALRWVRVPLLKNFSKMCGNFIFESDWKRTRIDRIEGLGKVCCSYVCDFPSSYFSRCRYSCIF